MNKILVCVVTHDYVDSLKDVMMKNIPLYDKYNMDVLVLNSSQNVDETVKFVEQLKQDVNHINIQHIHVPAAVRLEEKMQILFKPDEFNKHYDYVWPIGQRRVVSDLLCKKICDCIEEKVDFITVFNGNEHIKVIQDKNEYFHMCGEQSIMLGAAIYKTNILKELDLNELYLKYATSDVTTFYQMSVYFEGIATIDDFKGVYMRIPNAITLSSTNAVKYWEKSRFHTWATTFPPFVKGLPSIYKDKQQFIDSVQYEKFNLSVGTAIRCIKNGSLNKEVFYNHKKIFKKNARSYLILKILVNLVKI